MPRTRIHNVSAAQWSANGAALGSRDLTQAGNEVFGANVFSLAEQRKRLPKHVYAQLRETIARGAELDTSLADAVAQAMKEWALENGATHYTHWFQPLTGLTAEKHDSFYSPVGDGTAIADFSGKELIQGEPDASSFPTGGIRATFEARGYTAWDPTSPAFLLENPNGALLCIPTAFASWTGEALDHKIPLLRSMDALSDAALRALRLLGDHESQRVFTTVGPEQEYFLIDEQYYFERPDLVTTGRTLFGAKPPKGHELDDHYFGSIPERILACMLETESELAKLGVPVKTRHNEVAPNQYEIAPVFEGTNVGCDHQMLTMQVHAERRAALRPGLPAAREAVRRRQRLGQAQQLVDGHRHRAQPARARRHAAREPPVPAVRGRRDPGRRHPPAAAARVDRERGPGPPPRRQRGAAGDHLDLPRQRARGGLRRDRRRAGRAPSKPGSFLGLGTPVLPPLPLHSGDRNRTSPFAFTGNKFEFRALGSSQSPSFPNTVLNTIVAEAIDELADKLDAALKAGASLEKAILAIVKESYRTHRRIVFNGDNYSEAWHAEAEQRGLANLRSTPDALPWLVDRQTVAVFKRAQGAVASASSRPATRSSPSSTRRGSTSRPRPPRRSPARCCCRRRCATSSSCARPASRALIDETAELVERFADAIVALEKVNRPHPDVDELAHARTCATRCCRRWTACARSPTGSSGSSPTTSGRCRATRRCCSSSDAYGSRPPVSGWTRPVARGEGCELAAKSTAKY